MSADLRDIKKLFMAYRNGVVADALRAAGMDCYSVIFGLNLPQLSAIAGSVAEGHAPEELLDRADALWADAGVRESRLLALHLYGRAGTDRDLALRLMSEVKTREEAEVMCLRLLRNLPYAGELLAPTEPAEPLQAHLQKMLRRHLEA